MQKKVKKSRMTQLLPTLHRSSVQLFALAGP